jgi:hypothetical protein
MIWRELWNKSEAQQAFARMFTNLPNGLVTNAKLQRKKFMNNDFKRAQGQKWSTTSFCKNVHKSIPWLGDKCKDAENTIPKTKEVFARMFTNLSKV